MSAFFTAEALKSATLSELAEARAKAGFCPACQAQKLWQVRRELGLVFRGCLQCGTVVVLKA